MAETEQNELQALSTEELLALAQSKLKEKDFDVAIEASSMVLERRMKEADVSLAIAEANYLCGHAILSKIESSSDILGGAVAEGEDEEEEEGGDQEQAEEPEKKQQEEEGEQQKEGEEEKKSSEGQSGEGSGEVAEGSSTPEEELVEPEDERQDCWWHLESARVVFEKLIKSMTEGSSSSDSGKILLDSSVTLKDLKLGLAKVHMRLGDFGMENDQYDQSANDYLESAKIRNEFSAPFDILISEAYIQAAVVSLFANRMDQALSLYERAIDVYHKRVEHFKSEAGRTAPDAEDQIKDAEGVIEELKERIADYRDLQKLQQEEKAKQPASSAGASVTTTGFAKPKLDASAPVHTLTVRKKTPAAVPAPAASASAPPAPAEKEESGSSGKRPASQSVDNEDEPSAKKQKS